jgi:hypothetical protein
MNKHSEWTENYNVIGPQNGMDGEGAVISGIVSDSSLSSFET